jgi:hypothetical protein
MKQSWSFLGIGLATLSALSGAAQEAKEDVTLKVVKYDGLKDAVLKNRGKVVLIDFWGNF